MTIVVPSSYRLRYVRLVYRRSARKSNEILYFLLICKESYSFTLFLGSFDTIPLFALGRLVHLISRRRLKAYSCGANLIEVKDLTLFVMAR